MSLDNGQLTKNFFGQEFAVSEDYPHLAKLITFSNSDLQKLFYLATLNLQPERDKYNLPIKILSGKRTHALNRAVGGAGHSDHLFDFCSAACDFVIPGIGMEQVFTSMQGKNRPKNRQPFGQLIYYPDKNFIHVSLPTPKHHGEVFASA